MDDEFRRITSDFMQEQMHYVITESHLMGAKRILFSLQPTNTVRILLEPEKEFISGLSVFISYTTPDFDWARKIKNALEEIGFTVKLIEPSPLDEVKTDSEIRVMLKEYITSCDYLCLLFSERSVPREWVRFEFNLAASHIGRVILIKDNSVRTIRDFGMRKSSHDYPSFFYADIIVKHTIADFESADSDNFIEIARQIINDPEEGVTDGTYRPLTIRERDLKKENLYKRICRQSVLASPLFSNKNVIEVLPFTWDEINAQEGDFEGAFDWFVEKYGRYNMRHLVRAKKLVDVTPVNIDLTNTEWFHIVQGPVQALVLCKEDWDEEFEMNKNNVLF